VRTPRRFPAGRNGSAIPLKPPYPEPNACDWCGDPLEQAVLPETEPVVLVQLGRLCLRCQQAA
jgi:hypothetical protein